MAGRARLVIIGGGRMGEAIVGGLLAAGTFEASDITVVEPDPVRRETLQAAHGVRCAPDTEGELKGAATVLLAVKPQVIDDVVRSLAGQVPGGAVVVSIAAGVCCARLESLLPPGTPVIRVMPNTPALVREGMSVISGGGEATRAQVEDVRSMFAAVGDAVVLEERHQDAATAISGSGPAYVAMFVDALARSGVRQGLTRDVAQRLALQTLRGTAELLAVTGQHPESLVDAVSSPGGTTIAAIEALESRGFRSSVGEAVAAAVRRSKELGS